MQTPQAMIFAAGLGTRLKPITDRMPKALVPVGGQPLLWHVIQKLRAAGFERIVINVHHFADQISRPTRTLALTSVLAMSGLPCSILEAASNMPCRCSTFLCPSSFITWIY